MSTPMHPATPFRLRDLQWQVRSWFGTRLWAQVLLGLCLGIAVGAALSPEVGWVDRRAAVTAGAWLAVPGRLFLAIIGMVLVPLVMISIIKGMLGGGSMAQLRTVGLRLLLFVTLTTGLGAGLGVLLGQGIAPGAGIAAANGTTAARQTAQRPPTPDLPSLIVNLVPSNPQAALAERDMLAIVILALFLGAAALVADRTKTAPFLGALDGLLEISMTLVKWAMYLAPWAVFGLLADVIARSGLVAVAGLTTYVLTVLAGLLALMLLYVLIVTVFARRHPVDFLRRISGVMLLAFSTSSSAAVIPLSIDTAVRNLEVPESIANFTIPLGATINMAGTALYQAVAVCFLAQLSGVALTPESLATIVLTLIVTSIGAPGTPGVGIVILANIVTGFGIPTTGIALILGVDRLLDMFRTTVNVTGDLTVSVLLRNARRD
ncbi:dicarboxylate/amino acid:cation symporter [Nitrogeniibacter mangrovi]|uniref:Dicarboxylate/amino acid:cation symporter n=1 Tax=Nitrogeniibacter mangrovi TaxID=2016596 RepID=A0A6C1B738_9RHOO|nr:dicarboxylate/amino acid:cation symporter [Nitrogeniibacter mangrovi]QID19287.1 dicarboxylate/amino acid:cation symporter [Nitrogeniibacter mangrovi]